MSVRTDAIRSVWSSAAGLLEATLALAGEPEAPLVQARDGAVEIRAARTAPVYWDGQPWEAAALACELLRAALAAVEQTEDSEGGGDG